MKIGIGIITFLLTIIFATIAIQNNKIARKIVIQEFNLDQSQGVTKDKTIPKSKKEVFGKKWNDSFAKKWNNF